MKTLSSFEIEALRMRWGRECLAVLSSSRWAPALNVGGIDFAEACFSEAYLALQQCELVKPTVSPWARLRYLLEPAHLKSGILSRARGRVWSTSPGQADVVFHAVEATHLSQQLPVAQRLNGQGSTSLFITSRTRVIELLHKQQTNGLLLRSAWRSDLVAAARAGTRASHMLSDDPGIALPQPPSSIPHVSPEQLLELFKVCLIWLLPVAYEAARAAELIVQGIRPRLVVVGNDLTLEGRLLALVARRAGIPTASIMHGTVHDALHPHHVVDDLLVFGNAQRRTLADRHRIRIERMHVCGAPYLDSAPHQSLAVRPELSLNLGLREGQQFVLVALSNPANLVSLAQHEATIRNVMMLSARLPDVSFVARLHRADSPSHYQRLKNDVPGSRLNVVSHDEPGYPSDIMDWLQGCSVLLTGASAVATEAMLLEVPVVTMDFTGDYRGVDFIAAGATTHVTNGDDLVQAVSTLLHDYGARLDARERARQYLDDYFFSRDRRSAQRSAAVLRTLALRGRKPSQSLEDTSQRERAPVEGPCAASPE